MKNSMRPIHPGEVLREEFLAPLAVSANRLAQSMNVAANRVSEIVAERRSITAETALRLSRALGTTPEFWMNLQDAFELRSAERTLAAKLKSIRPLRRRRR
jgi:addiction module HigA family antidote